MADRKASGKQPEKPKDTSGNVVTRFIRRLSPTKKNQGSSTPGASSSSPSAQGTASLSKKQDASSRKESKTSEKPSKMSLNLPESKSCSTSKKSLGSSSNLSTWITPAPSYQSLDQEGQSTEMKLLSHLHSNFDEATDILEKYISLRDRKK